MNYRKIVLLTIVCSLSVVSVDCHAHHDHVHEEIPDEIRLVEVVAPVTGSVSTGR